MIAEIAFAFPTFCGLAHSLCVNFNVMKSRHYVSFVSQTALTRRSVACVNIKVCVEITVAATTIVGRMLLELRKNVFFSTTMLVLCV